MNKNKISQDTNDIGSFLSKLKKEDSNLEMIFKILKVTYIVLLIVYIPIFYDIIDGGKVYSIIKVASIVLGFSMFLFSMAYAQHKIKKINYSVPTLVLLKKTVKRYRVFSPLDLVVFPALFFLAIGLALNEKVYLACQDYLKLDFSLGDYFTTAWQVLNSGNNWFEMISKTSNEFPLLIVMACLSFFFIMVVISFGLGIAIWFARFKPIRDNALELIREIES
ncbi:hypothetical protein L3049_03465 [Labilibaculum sp. DW002]|uniref:Uncharacterized protein n=1 Tax=Paralabilibaculum antarcticum TaxID=2912572 RepID=A0ABT5VNP8_9BACT|nr:hypothetical protein [Labilibaculum sp. DW002]MDE5417055.1 hypothetical protein [Labilibaculum sp. DW002]